MFSPADAPSPKGWSKRRANAQVRQEQNKKMFLLREARQAHYAAQAAGFANAEEHAAAIAAAAKPIEAVVAPVDAVPVPVAEEASVSPAEPLAADVEVKAAKARKKAADA